MKQSRLSTLNQFKCEEFFCELTAAIRVAEQAGELIRQRWDTPLVIENKGSVDLVSEVDKAAECIIIEGLTQEFPHDSFIAEESGQAVRHGTRTWHIDPLDGTTNFAHGFPHFATSICLAIDDDPIVGVIYEPMRDWCFWSMIGHGAFRNGVKLSVSSTRSLSESLVATGFPYNRWSARDNNSHRASHLLRYTRGLRRAGAAALDLAYVAAGWLDGYWEHSLSSWDISAGILLVREAGGCVTDFGAVPAHVLSDTIVASNGHIHDHLVLEIERAPMVATVE